MDCIICYDKFTSGIHCQFCSAPVCTTCAKAYMLSSFQDPHCPVPSCLKGWSDEFVSANFTKSFVNGSLTKHRQDTWLERQRALLPGRQHLVSAARALRDANLALAAVRADMEGAEMALKLFNITHDQIRTALANTEPVFCHLCGLSHALPYYGQHCVLKEALAAHGGSLHAAEKAHGNLARGRLQAAVTPLRERYYVMANRARELRYASIFGGGAAAAKKEPARAFVRACPVNECRGFLSTAWKCGVCTTWVCAKCHEVKAEQHDAGHLCNPDNVATAELLAKDTKPCPSCAAGIFKIAGCDQMWCTSCNSGFDWKSGKRIETNRIHNPHFFEYASRILPLNAAAAREDGGAAAGGGGAPRGCQQQQEGMRGLPGNGAIATLPFHCYEFAKAFRRSAHIGQIVGDRYARLVGRDAEEAQEELAVTYLMSDITEQTWKQRLQRAEKRQRKYHAILDVIRGYDVACSDVFQALASRQISRDQCLHHEGKLHEMMMAALRGVCTVYTCKMPRLGEL